LGLETAWHYEIEFTREKTNRIEVRGLGNEYREELRLRIACPYYKGYVDLYKPKFVLELGIGYYSTPLFKNMEYSGVENSREWIDLLGDGLNIAHHDLGDLGQQTKLEDISNMVIGA